MFLQIKNNILKVEEEKTRRLKKEGKKRGMKQPLLLHFLLLVAFAMKNLEGKGSVS